MQHGLGISSHHVGGLLQGGALGFKSVHKAADAVFVGAEGTFNGGDFLVDDFFKCGGALKSMFNAAHQKINFLTHSLRNRGEAVSGNVLRADQAHGLMHHYFRCLAQLLGAPKQVANHCGAYNRHDEQGEGLQEFCWRVQLLIGEQIFVNPEPADGPND